MNELALLRDAIIKALPKDCADSLEEIEPRLLYIPLGHTRALKLESAIVIGERGVGKTFWAKALSSQSLRTLLTQPVPELEKTDIYVGYASNANPNVFPDKDTFAKLFNTYSAYDIWRTVIMRCLMPEQYKGAFSDSIARVYSDPEEVAMMAKKVETDLKTQGRYVLILFDALDRISDDWNIVDQIVSGLLKAVQWLKSYFHMHAKIFLRKDQYERLQGSFTDASKLMATRVELKWSASDLHGLLWQQLCNAPEQYGKAMRQLYANVIGNTPQSFDSIFMINDIVKRDLKIQRRLFEKLAGPWMGNGPKKGAPYTWLVNHLGDAYQQVSPRSFVAAIREAANDSLKLSAEYRYALHFESIKKGVQRASETRVAEVAEDFPWVKEVMQPLQGLSVPIEYAHLEKQWKTRIDISSHKFKSSLPPSHIEKGWIGVCEDLERLGIFKIMRDGRINMPDIYRVGFKLGRKGGVKPIR